MSEKLELAILRAVGLDPSEVRAFMFRASVTEPPTITVDFFVGDPEPLVETKAYRLEEVDP